MPVVGSAAVQAIVPPISPSSLSVSLKEPPVGKIVGAGIKSVIATARRLALSPPVL